MRHAIVENGVVVNVVLADEVTGRANGWISTDEAGPEWVYAGGIFSAPPPNPKREAAAARNQRDALLAESDIAVYPDRWARMIPEQQTAWSNYRQALRDISMQDGFPLQINWPVKPE